MALTVSDQIANKLFAADISFKSKTKRGDHENARQFGSSACLHSWILRAVDNEVAACDRGCASRNGESNDLRSSIKLRRRVYEFLMDCSGLLDDSFAMVIHGMRR
jgi:hypothetical protein